MKILYTSIITIWMTSLLILSSYAQTPDKIDGWNKAKWGMTEEEIIEAFQGQVQKREMQKMGTNRCSTLKIDNITLVDKQFKVIFIMDCNTKKLKVVIIEPSSKWRPYENFIAFDRLEEELIKKYGEPRLSKSSNKNMESRSRVWVFPMN